MSRPGADRVVEEGGVHRLANRIVAAEREAEVRDPAARPRARAALLDQRHRLDERLRELVVLLDSGRDGEDVRIEDQVLRREADLVDEQPVRPLADLDLALDRVRLALLVERHHDDAGAVAANRRACSRNASSPSLREIELTTPFPWRHFSPASSTDQRELSTMIGRRATSGSVATQVQERRHRLLAVEQVGVHVHVEDVGPAAHLLDRDVDRLLEVAALDEAAEAGRAGDVRALADHRRNWRRGGSRTARGR